MRLSAGLAYLLAILSLPLTACAPAIARDWVRTQAAYQRAARGPAAELRPWELRQAQLALFAAEDACADDPAAPETRTLVLEAERKIAHAEALAAADRLEPSRWAVVVAHRQWQARLAPETLGPYQSVMWRPEPPAAIPSPTAAAALPGLPQTKEPVRIPTREVPATLRLSGSVLFDEGRATLRPGARARIERMTAELAWLPYETIVVEGHADGRGHEDGNLRLSVARAEAVRQHLIRWGFDERRIRVVGYGTSRPVADNALAEGRATNRRVGISLEP